MDPMIDLNSTSTDPIIAALTATQPCTFAVIVGIEGPSYRPLGAMMTIFASGDYVGTLSSGCVEADIALHAVDALVDNTTRVLRYGAGSPFFDIELPCGGGLEILLIPNPDVSVLQAIEDNRSNRRSCTLEIDFNTGTMSLANNEETARLEASIKIRLDPEIRFLVFGKGPEAGTFATLVNSAGYPTYLLSPDEETLKTGSRIGCRTIHMQSRAVPNGVDVDYRTSIVLFFHDHDWEPPILQWALKSDAFYIGSQGSMRARNSRDIELRLMGVRETDLKRLKGPIGLIPSTRDAGTLAVSVLAEVLADAMKL